MVPVNICIPIQMGIFLQSMEILERMERQKNNKTMHNKRPGLYAKYTLVNNSWNIYY
jgi:hypothetical protein